MARRIREFRQTVIDCINNAEDIDIEVKRLVLTEILQMVTNKAEEVLRDELRADRLAEQTKHGNADQQDESKSHG